MYLFVLLLFSETILRFADIDPPVSDPKEFFPILIGLRRIGINELMTDLYDKYFEAKADIRIRMLG